MTTRDLSFLAAGGLVVLVWWFADQEPLKAAGLLLALAVTRAMWTAGWLRPDRRRP